jgi:hypothetical protein
MGKLLKVLGLAFLVLIVLFAGLLFWAARAGSKLQEEFFAAVGTGKTDTVLAIMAPTLRAEIDEPMLAAWIATINTKLGPYKGMRKTDFNTSSRLVDGVTVTQSVGTVDFEHGTAKSELVFHNGQLAGFHLQSEQLGRQSPAPANNDFYRERGQQFLTHLAGGDLALAFAMMHPELQKAVPLEKLKASTTALREQGGPLQSVVWEKEQAEAADGQRLKLFYKVQLAKQAKTGMVTFQFHGLKGHLLAFELVNPDQKPGPAAK